MVLSQIVFLIYLLFPLQKKQGVRGEVTVEQYKSIHDEIRQQIEGNNAKYKEAADRHKRKLTFDDGDYVWVILTKDRYPTVKYNKLSERKINPCEVIKKINNNAYQIKLPSHLKTPDVFNVKHLNPNNRDSSEDEEFNSRTSSFQPGKDDAVNLAIEFIKTHDSTKPSRRSR